jgi:phenylpropionate dioxygenase-like ring-hydroxylating dioxygenase large terminal subunit
MQKRVQVATTEVLLTRSEDGTLAAVSNVCRHRAMLLVEDTTQAPLVRCPYHLWVYGLDGKLKNTPFMERETLSDCDLPRYAVGEWAGFVFVNLDGKAAPIAPMLEPIAGGARAAELGNWVEGFRIAFTHDWNWKVMLENFAESYHHIGAHAQTLQPFWPGGVTDATPSTNQWIELRHPNHPDAGTFTVFVVFPMFLLAVSDPVNAAYWYRMIPKGPARIELEIVGLFPPDIAADPAAMEMAKAQLTAIHLEDIPMCARTQAGLEAANATIGPLSKLEEGIARFRSWVR